MSEEENYRFDNVNVLLVEENEMNIEIIKYALESTGANVTIATNGREAVDILEDSEKNEYNVILMNDKLPVMDGYETASEIRRLDSKYYSRIKIIMMISDKKGEDEVDIIHKKKENVVDEYIFKPINMHRLAIVIKNLLA